MHYYQFNIGDYAKSTKYLSELQDLAYRRLLDICYDSEKPLPKTIKEVAEQIGFLKNPDDVEVILKKYFKLTKNGFTQKRVQKEIVNYRCKGDIARANGKKGGRPKGKVKITQLVNLANPDITGLKAKQEPITNNHKPIIKTIRFTPPSAQEVNSYAIEKSLNLKGFFDYYESNGWKVGKNKMKKWKSSASGWSSRQGGFNNQTNQDFSDESTDWVNQNHGIII